MSSQNPVFVLTTVTCAALVPVTNVKAGAGSRGR
jgi:hypothetical protein